MPLRTRIENICGLSQCVNPTHWQVFAPAAPHLLVPSPDGWQLVDTKTNKPVDRGTTVFVRSPLGVVHRLDVTPGGMFMPCNTPFDPGMLVVTIQPPTCDGCR